MQDKDIIRQIQRGDKELLRDVIEKYYDEILHFCMYQIKDSTNAYDLAQETFYRFIRCVDTYEYKNLKGYLIAIARNLCVDYWRGNMPLESLDEEIALKEDRENPNGCGEYERLENQMMLAQLLSGIPEEQREVIVMRYYHDLKYKDIAKILGVKLSTVKSRLRLGITNLQKGSERNDGKGNI